MLVTARAPVRVDFGGAWTDVEVFARHAAATGGGVVVNAAISQYVSGSFHARQEGEGAEAREGLDVSYGFDLPSGSGLGTSAALNVVWLALIRRSIAPTAEDRREIAELAYRMEGLLGILGGRQDQYAAALGGFNFMTFGPDGTVEVEPLAVPADAVRELESRSVLCYTGKPRLSGAIHENVWGAFERGRTATVDALYGLRDVAVRMRPALLAGDVDTFADLLAENWRHQKRLDPSITNPQMDQMFAASQAAGARGGKACGAGGGGCLYFVAESADKRATVARALADSGARIIDFTFAFDGLTVSEQADGNAPERCGPVEYKDI